jgi:RAD51-like protein 2
MPVTGQQTDKFSIKQQIGKASTVHRCAVSFYVLFSGSGKKLTPKVMLVTQMGTKSLSAEGKRVDFGSGEKVVLMPQLGEL